MPELVLCFENCAALFAEYEKNLVHGRAFVPGEGSLPIFSPCTLAIEHPETHRRELFACEVVMVLQQGTEQGTAVQFTDRGEANLRRLRDFVSAQGAGRTKLSPAFDDESTGVIGRNSSDESALPDFEELDDEQTNPFGGPPTGEHERAARKSLAAARANKLKGLTPQERMHVARGSVPEDRVLLERLYGSAVWELLLRNPKITVPEVARMARKGTLPRPLLDLIAENEQWIRHSLVRRALLANPRLSPDAVTRVLRTLPPRELKLVPQQTAYPQTVRQAAARLMRG